MDRTWLVNGKLLQLGPLQGLPEREAKPAPAVTVTGLTLRSDRVEAEFSDTADLRRLVIDGQIIRLEGSGHALWSYPDHPAISAAWDVDRGTLANGEPARFTGAAKIEHGVGLAALTFAGCIPKT